MTIHGHVGDRTRVGCSVRGQSNGYVTSSVFTDPVEEVFGDLLRKLTVPATDQEELVTLWKRSHKSPDDSHAERNRLKGDSRASRISTSMKL